jgi:hypothetical protein
MTTDTFSIPKTIKCGLSYHDLSNFESAWEKYPAAPKDSNSEKSLVLYQGTLRPNGGKNCVDFGYLKSNIVDFKTKKTTFLPNKVFQNRIFKNLKVIGVTKSSGYDSFFLMTEDGIVLETFSDVVFDALKSCSITGNTLDKDYTFVHSSKTGVILTPLDSPVYKSALNTATERSMTKLDYTKLNSGYIYKTPGGNYSLFLGHVSTIQLDAIGLSKALFPTPTKADWSNKDNHIKQTELLKGYKSYGSNNKFFSDYHVKAKPKYVEYGTLWLDFKKYHQWMFKHPDLNSAECISELTTHIKSRTNNVYLREMSIRTRSSFVKSAIQHRFDVPYDEILTSTRTLAMNGSLKTINYYSTLSSEQILMKLIKHTTSLVPLSNVSPLGNYPQVSTCFNSLGHLIIKPETR